MDSCLFKLLKLFIENGPMTMQEIAVFMDSSSKTVLKRISELNNILGDSAHISAGLKRFKLEINNYSEFIKLETKFLKGELDLNDPQKRQQIIAELLVKESQTFIPIDVIADKVAVSRKVINKDLECIKENLTKYQGKIISKTGKGIRLVVADNFNLLCFIRNYVVKDSQKFDVQIREVIPVIRDLGLHKTICRQIAENVASLAIFENCGYRLTKIPFEYLPLWKTEKLSYLIERLKNKFSGITKYEIFLLLSPLDLFKNKYQDQENIENVLQKNRDFFLHDFAKQLNQYSLDPETVYERMKWHLLFSIKRSLFHVKIAEVLPQNLSDNYPVSLELSLALADCINRKLSIQLDKSEINYYVVYFEILLEKISKSDENQVRIAFVGAIRSSVRDFITEKLSVVFDNLSYEQFTDVNDLKNNDQKYLLVFADEPLNIKNRQVINLGTVFRPAALSKIIKISYLEQKVKQGKIKLSVNHYDINNYHDLVDRMIDEQIKIGELHPEFKQAWLKREEKTNNIFSNGIAIPHATDNSDHKRILCCVGIVDGKIKFKKSNLKLVFLFAIPHKLDPGLINVISSLYDFTSLVSRNEIIYNNFLEYDSRKSLIQLIEGI